MMPGMKIALGIAAAALVLTACSSTVTSKAAGPVTASPPAATTTASATEASSAPPTAEKACADLKSSDLLKSVAGFILVANAVSPGDVTPAVDQLTQIRDEAPPEFTNSLDNIIKVLTDLDAFAKAGGGEVDTSAFIPDSNLLADMCRVRGFAVPAVPQ